MGSLTHLCRFIIFSFLMKSQHYYIHPEARKSNTMRVGLGMAALGRPGYINLQRNAHLPPPDSRTVEGMRDRAYAVMDELFRLCREWNHEGDDVDDGGGRRRFVPWLDCARSYGMSEVFVGDYLRLNRIPPDDVYVSSKWGYTYVAGWNVELGEGEPHEVKDHSLEVSERIRDDGYCYFCA
jgi:hypothetical protein